MLDRAEQLLERFDADHAANKRFLLRRSRRGVDRGRDNARNLDGRKRHIVVDSLGLLLAGVVRERGAPGHVRSDNGPEFIAKAVRAWMAAAGLETLYIEPGAPWENGYAESFNSKVRDELLNAEEFGSVVEAKVLAKGWRQDYNHVRPHSSLGYRTPAEYAAMVPRDGAAQRNRPEEPSVTVEPTLTAPGP